MPPHWFSLATSSIVDRMKGLLEVASATPRTTKSSVEHARKIHDETRSRILEATGLVLEGKKGLDIGPDHRLGCLRCFSLSNDVVAIDTDAVADGIDLVGLARDFRFRSALARELGIGKLPLPRVMRMPTGRMDFDDASFDFVYSLSAFEHLADPAAALAEVKRVLRPGGVAYISVHLYTSHSGSHDPGTFATPRLRPPYWPHLRPNLDDVRASSSHNRLSLAQWRALFGRILPGATITERRDDEHLVQALKTLRAWGQLAEYTDEELLTVEIVAIFQNPRMDEAPMSRAPLTEPSMRDGSGVRPTPCA
jgi:SAM-dependent methyltransferase